MNGSVAGFWSYAHADNACEQNRILRLAELVRNEYSLTTGRDLILFADRTEHHWASEWRDRVEKGLDTTTFFVPIITPRYLRQPECRRELLDFVTRARNLGVAETVLPIVYTHTRDLNDATTPDEAAALVRRMRCEKWHDLRTDDETSVAHRRAVSRLVARLVEISSLRHNGSRTLDVVSALAEAVPRWGEAFGMMDSAMGRIDTRTEKLVLEMEHAHFDEDSAIGRLSILRTYADEIMKPARDMLAFGSEFADEVRQLDPSILALLHRATKNAETEDFVDHCRSLILATARRLRRHADVLRDYGRTMHTIAGLSEILDDPVNDVAVGVRSMMDGIALISEWEQRILSSGGQTE